MTNPPPSVEGGPGRPESDHAIAWRQTAEQWIAVDREHGAHLRRLLSEDPAQAEELFAGRLSFGTAGLRAPMGPGPLRMNRLVVRQTTAGLLQWLSTRDGISGQGGLSGQGRDGGPTIVVGFDARHQSEVFAHDVARVALATGARVALIERPAPTPVLARAVLDYGADAGVMITASHNPPADNGYKLYLGDGLQIVPPADTEIARCIERFSSRDPLENATDGDEWESIADEALAAHRVAARHALTATPTEGARRISIVYTPIHGVGGRQVLEVLQEAGFPAPTVVPEQFNPDPDFPGTPFPNPEEPGTLDAALELAERLGADVVLANDPDADRLAVAVPDRSGRWARLTGDEVGVLLADRALRLSEGSPPGESGNDVARRLVASSIVSSQMIDRLAAAAGVESVRTLTGFKWVARPIVDRPEVRFLFGYEEALGYCVGDQVRDKDGVSAALAMADLVAELKVAGQSLRDRLDDLAIEHGLYATSQVTVRFDHVAAGRRDDVMAQASNVAPDELAGSTVVERIDLRSGERFPPTPGVVLYLDDGSRVVVRPSGTEPKIKAYLEVCQSVGSPGMISETRDATDRRLEELATAVQKLLNPTPQAP